MTKKLFATWLIGLGCLVSFAAFAAEPNPSGTVSISSKSVAVGVGVSWGDGKLTYGSKTYTFSIQGLSVLDLGISTITSSGEVFNLKTVSDCIAIAGGQNDVIMKNENGVVIRLHGTQQGVKFTLAPQGVAIKLK
ncbi:MAG: DUF1134 domain-containing protein [Betaproteobacteria bacterium]|nr:MAG: DUF1134 domain-containing protein [Betaproteobacteria bacterium]